MSNHGISRRTFAKTIGVAAATATVGAGAAKAAPSTSRDEFRGMLVDGYMIPVRNDPEIGFRNRPVHLHRNGYRKKLIPVSVNDECFRGDGG